MSRLNQKIALVVGGARGIGAETVRRFLDEGAVVYSTDLLDSEAAPAERLTHIISDATDETAVAEVATQVLNEQGRIDVLLCNVGIHLGKPITDTAVEDLDRIWMINVGTAVLAIKHVLPAMRDQRAGSIIIMSSNGGMMGRPADPVYNATKHALVGLAKSLAVAYAHEGIRVNSINPGAIDTDMLRGTIPSLAVEFEKKAVASTPAARVGHPSEVAMTVVFLASDESRFINGAVVPVDGAKAAGALHFDRYSLDFDLFESRWS